MLQAGRSGYSRSHTPSRAGSGCGTRYTPSPPCGADGPSGLGPLSRAPSLPPARGGIGNRGSTCLPVRSILLDTSRKGAQGFRESRATGANGRGLVGGDGASLHRRQLAPSRKGSSPCVRRAPATGSLTPSRAPHTGGRGGASRAAPRWPGRPPGGAHPGKLSKAGRWQDRW